MTVGSPTQSGKPQVGLRYQCLTGQNRGREMDSFPTAPCTGGIFTTHHFPASVCPLSASQPDVSPILTLLPNTDAGTARTSTAPTTSRTCTTPSPATAS